MKNYKKRFFPCGCVQISCTCVFFYLAYDFVLQTHLSHTAAYYCTMHSISILLYTAKRIFCMLVLYFWKYAKWIHGGDDDECHKKLRGPRHGMSGDNTVYSTVYCSVYTLFIMCTVHFVCVCIVHHSIIIYCIQYIIHCIIRR